MKNKKITFTDNPLDISRYFGGGGSSKFFGQAQELTGNYGVKLDGTLVGFSKVTGAGDELRLTNQNLSDRLKDRFMSAAKNVGITKEMKKYRSAREQLAGGDGKVDGDIDDLDDAFAALGITKLTLVPKKQLKKVKKTVDDAKNNNMKDSTKKMGGGVLLLGAAAVIGYMVIK